MSKPDPALQAQTLLEAVDRNARHVGMRPPSGARGVEMLEVFTLRAWAALAKQNKVAAPDREVVALILRMVLERGDLPGPRQLRFARMDPPETKGRQSA